jgi:hypothetical protein
MKKKDALLFLSFDCDKTHRWARNRFANGGGINRIGFASLHIGLHIHRWDQPYIMAQLT